MELKVKMARIENILVAQVLEQNDDLRGADIMEDEDGYEIRSNCTPQLNGYEFYVRGSSREEDNKVVCYEYNTVEKAIKAAKHFKKLIDRINDNDLDDLNWNVEKII